MSQRALTIEQLSYPQLEPVTPGEAADQAMVDCEAEEDRLKALISAARAHVEDRISGAIIEQRVRAGYEYSNRGYRELILPRPPLLDVERVFFVDGTGAEHAIDPSAYTVSRSSRLGAYLRFKSALFAPSGAHTTPLYVEFKAGYGAASDAVPPQIKQAILLVVDDWYNNTALADSGAISGTIDKTVSRLLSPFRETISI